MVDVRNVNSLLIKRALIFSHPCVCRRRAGKKIILHRGVSRGIYQLSETRHLMEFS